jgi:hypothetical protein
MEPRVYNLPDPAAVMGNDLGKTPPAGSSE